MEAKTTEAMQRVLGALLEGSPVPEGARAQLTDAERAEIDALVATAVLTRTALRSGEPPPPAEAASLRRVQSVLPPRPHPEGYRGRATPTTPGYRPAGGLAAWIARWFGERRP